MSKYKKLEVVVERFGGKYRGYVAPAGVQSAEMFYSKTSGRALVSQLLRLDFVTEGGAKKLLRIIEASDLPEASSEDPPERKAFRPWPEIQQGMEN